VSGASRDEGDLTIRRATAADRADILALLAASLGRDGNDPRYEALFAWKHEQNAFGRSPTWLACDGARIVGIRVLMPWEFRRGDVTIRAVRAVDTATHPDYQGRGIFTRLTLHAIEELRNEGIDFVFNTPNDQSRPGYLKMGWQVVGRLPTSVRPVRLGALPRIVSARVPAERWSASTTAGDPAADVLADDEARAELLASLPTGPALRTHRTPAYLRWRYGSPLLGYRAIVGSRGLAGGVALFRIRNRGPAREVALCDLLVPRGDPRVARRLTQALVDVADADYVIRLGGGVVAPGPMVRLPGQGPLLTWRAVSDPVVPREWDLTLGDIELF
jgi:GNAT superfamily N-acetyltransferase